jgi:hypothetical protein
MNKKIFRVDLNAEIIKALMMEKSKTYKVLAEEFGVGLSYVNEIAKKNGIARPRGPKPSKSAKA